MRRTSSVRVKGRTFRNFRLQLEWTQSRAAELSGYSERLIRKVERGEPTNRQTLEDLLDLYREHLPELANLTVDQLTVYHSEQELKQLISAWFERALNQRDPTVFDDMISADISLVA